MSGQFDGVFGENYWGEGTYNYKWVGVDPEWEEGSFLSMVPYNLTSSFVEYKVEGILPPIDGNLRIFFAGKSGESYLNYNNWIDNICITVAE
jgi:hypothetical protein